MNSTINIQEIRCGEDVTDEEEERSLAQLNCAIIGQIIHLEWESLEDSVRNLINSKEASFWSRLNPWHKKKKHRSIDSAMKMVEQRIEWLYEAYLGRYDNLLTRPIFSEKTSNEK